MKFLNLRKNFNKIFFILAVFSFIGFASASIPQLIAFQGKLTDKNGALINGNTLITFKIYTTQTGGSPIYTESDNINVSNGLVSWLIGSKTTLTLPFDQQYYLGVTVDVDVEMTPRLALSDAPYAFNSINANNSAFLNGTPGSSYALVNGNYPSMTVGNATNANNSNNSAFLGGVAASSYFQNGGALTASSASIGGHTPWTAASCSWTNWNNITTTPNVYNEVDSPNCPANTVPITGECVSSSDLYITEFGPTSSYWFCGYFDNSPYSVTIATRAKCCPS